MAVMATLAGCSRSGDPAPAAAATAPAVPQTVAPIPATTSAPEVAHAAGVAWATGDVDAAFAAARAEHKPVFLYWGAVWCPPCNQVKATIFNRVDFIDRSRFFVPVYIDGDSPSAQRLGARFNVSGYPTMVLFKSDGTEITRLPGEVEAAQYMRVLALGMNGARSVQETLRAAAGPAAAALTPDDWRMLAYYSWDTDEQQLVATRNLAPTLRALAAACPATQADTATRLRLRALVAEATAKDAKPRDDVAATAIVRRVLADPQLARANFDLLTNYSDSVVGLITRPGSTARVRLAADWNALLERFAADADVSTAERLNVVAARVALARLQSPKGELPATLMQTVRQQVARADAESKDPYTRQVVIDAAAGLLAEAGAMRESDALLTAELSRSHSPYYFMLDLASNALKRGDKSQAIAWNEKAYAAARGPATRLQWGVHYVAALIDLTPEDARRIEATAQGVIDEIDPTPDTFYERNRRALERMGKKLVEWNKRHQHDAALARVRAQMAQVCTKLPTGDPARATCTNVLRPASA